MMETEAAAANTVGTEPVLEGADIHENTDINVSKQNVEEADNVFSSVILQEETEQRILPKKAIEKSAENGDVINDEENCDRNLLGKPDDNNRILQVDGDCKDDGECGNEGQNTVDGTAVGARELEEDTRQQTSCDNKSGNVHDDTVNGDRTSEVNMEESGDIGDATLEIKDTTAALNEGSDIDTYHKQIDSKHEDSSDCVNGAAESEIDSKHEDSSDCVNGAAESEIDSKHEDSSDCVNGAAESVGANDNAKSDGASIGDSGPGSAETSSKTQDEGTNPELKSTSIDLATDNGTASNMEPVISKSDTSSTNNTQSEGLGSEKPIKVKCLKCSRVMKDKRLIENHSCEGEVEEEKVKITIMLDKNKQGFVCKECDYTSTGHSFEEHLMCHLMVRPYQCLYCKECFINRKEISRHVVKIHNGAKMSCALRALKKAKALIKEVTSSGVLSFMARVAGKVPLEKDPDKKKQEDNKGGQSVRESSSNEKKIKESIVPCQSNSDKDSQNVVKESEISQNKSQSGGTVEDSNPRDHASNSESKVEISPSCTNQNVSDKEQPAKQLCKLKEALTSDSPVGISKITINEEQGVLAETSSKPHNSETECGLKIVASFSLQHLGHPESDTAETGKGEKGIQPNFIMSSPVEKEQEMEVLSFLGPDRPVFKSSDNSCTPMLPPPPLQLSPFHSPNTNQAAGSGLKQEVKNSNFFVCGFNCGFSSLSTNDFLEHTMNSHSTETYFPCFYCGHRSPNEADLVRHISNHTHTHSSSLSLYVCGNSGCRFGTNMVVDYITHIKTSHSDILEPVCYSCGNTFPEPSLLQAHVEQNVIHIVNCPHCSSKATDRKTILTHISSAHPGKPKMVSVAKQLICYDRKINNYEQMVHLREMLPPAFTPAPFANGASGIDQIFSSHEMAGDKFSGRLLPDVSTAVPSLSPRYVQVSPSGEMSHVDGQKAATPESGKSPGSESSDFDSMKVKEEINEDPEEYVDGTGEDSRSAYVVDENGVRRRIYVPMSERKAENYRCKHCTFIARDSKRMHCHERSHGMPPTRKERFKCMFCPQGFDSELKFRLHITCHPGLIKFLLYRCKKCEFDTNQKHIIVKHITCNRDRKHRGFGPLEDQYTVVSRSLESRVLECERCEYMTRHKIHMTIHYQRKHNILKDKSDFTIENLMPTDTPVASPSPSLDASPTTSSLFKNFHSPGSFHDDSFDFTKPSASAKNSKSKSSLDSPVSTPAQIVERNELFNRMVSQQAALQPGHMMENQMRKFKCPICKYLLPKAADLKNHVKRHSEMGQITLVMFRCKYCSCMSTARELLYEHLIDKHPGKAIALVKKIVIIDTADVEKSFAETSVEESLAQLEESLQKEMMSTLNSGSSGAANGLSPSYEQIFVMPEGEDTFSVSLQCPRCSYSSYIKNDIVDHINTLHPEVRVIGSDEDVDNLARANSEGLQEESKPNRSRLDSQEDVLILPDDPVFNEPTLCSRCDFTTMFRKEMVDHLQQNHPEIPVMGHNSYPVQASAIEEAVEPADESCVVGSANLDAKVRCLYENYGTQMKCLICGAERPKKFFIHVHILRHLNIYLWKCTFCPHRGLQKYKMIDHIKKIHPGKPLSVRYLRVDVEDKVSHFLSQFSVIRNRKASLDEGNYVPFTSDELSDQASSDSSRSRQKSPGPGNDTSCAHSLGSEELDTKISCMYDNYNDVHFKCRVCPAQFQRKFAMHRHIIISHLKVALLSCAYCGMEGVERHQLVDHILTCHKPAPISIHTLDIDLHKMACDFLAKTAAKAQNGSFDMGYSGIGEGSGSLSFSNSSVGEEEEDHNQTFTYNPNNKLKLNTPKYTKFMKPPTFRFGNKTPGTSGSKTNRKVDPDVVMLGRYALDKKLSCLYQERPSGQFRCLVCRWEFPRKYPLHRHIMLRHLKLSLVGCPYCPFEGIEKYNVTTHVREEHKDKPINIKFTQPDVEARVRQFVDNMANSGVAGHKDLIQKPPSKRKLMQAALNIEKQSDEEMDNNDDDDDDDEDDNVQVNRGNKRNHHSGLVVAMFGKKKQNSDKDIVVKTEVDEEQMEEGSALQTNSEEFKDYKREGESGDIKTDFEALVSNASSLKFSQASSYTPGFYRSPAGGKAKALDVITKIKVLKSKEGSIMKFYCEKCKFTSLHRSNIVRHIYKIHEKYQTHTCPMCNYQTLSPMLMERHLDKAHQTGESKDDSYTQNSFSKSFMGLPIVKKKKKSFPIKQPEVKPEADSYTGPKHYACAYCYYETNTQADILQHTRDNHSQGDSNATETKPSPSFENSTVKPEETAAACWDGSKKAVKRKLQDEEVGVYKRKRRFIFEKGNELIQCGHCETKETSMSRMQDHITWDHPGLPFQAKQIPAWRFLCKSCSVKTMATSKMKYHLNRHISYRPYTCVTCGAFFPSPDQCRRHSRSQAHEEQYTYVRNPKKEAKVEELLEATRQLALKVQEEAARNPDFEMSQAENFISTFQESRSNLKKNPQGNNTKQSKKAAAAAVAAAKAALKAQKKQTGKSPQILGTEQETTIKCYYCEYISSNVNSVNTHHKEAHPSKKFLWTEIERGFTCDSTGEALVDCDSVPGASMDVGYTTRMTLGSGNNTMRFKCKTCDFSSFVIQAMKSHLKSHQPKGFICPYCSRSFSGKEKLMRHQYCLHKGQPLWVIHLRRSGVIGATSVKKGKGVPEEDSCSAMQENTKTEEDEDTEEANGSEKLAKTNQSGTTKYFCNECSFSSESLNHFRRHLAQKHQESKQKAADNSVDESRLKCSYCPFLANTKADFDSHAETHLSTGNFQCGYCEYSALDRPSVQQHSAADHSSLEPKISEKGARENKNGHGRKEQPLLLNLKPNVSVERIPDSVLTQYGYQTSDGADTSSDDDNNNEESTLASSDEITQPQTLFEDAQSDNSKDDRLMPAEDTSQLSLIESEDSHHSSSSSHSVTANDQEENFVTDNFDSNLNVPTDSDELARELGLVEDETSCVLGSDADMMIMQFGGIVENKDTDLPDETIYDETVQSDESDLDNNVAIVSPSIQGSGSVFCSKDSTLFAAQENDDDEDEDGAVRFDNDIMLTSPLPMISLGDDVSVSPMNVEGKIDNEDSSFSMGNPVAAMDIDASSEVLLDI